jgi:hypothetical protein
MTAIIASLKSIFPPELIRVKSQKDVVVSGNGVYLSIYFRSASRRGGADFLLGGNCHREYADAVELLHELARELNKNGIIYSLELTEGADSQQVSFSILHPKFSEEIGD